MDSDSTGAESLFRIAICLARQALVTIETQHGQFSLFNSLPAALSALTRDRAHPSAPLCLARRQSQNTRDTCSCRKQLVCPGEARVPVTSNAVILHSLKAFRRGLSQGNVLLHETSLGHGLEGTLTAAAD